MEGLLAYVILLTLRTCVLILDTILDLTIGFTISGGSKEERLKSKDYEHSAHVVNVLMRAKPLVYVVSTEQYFLYHHEKYVHPRYILESANVTLMGVEKDYALFCVSDPDVDVYDTKKFPFVYYSQFYQSRKLVILPVESFHRLADELGDPKVSVALLNMTARCGSTLLAQVFHRVPNTRSMSEPWATCNINKLRCTNKITVEESKRLLRSGIRLQAKVEPGTDIKMIFMKLCTLNSAQFEEMSEMFPDMHLLFNTRHPTPSVRSFRYLLQVALLDTLHWKLGTFWQDLLSFNFFFPYHSKYRQIYGKFSRWYQDIDPEEIAVVNYCASLASYFDAKDIYSRVVLYENLAENPEAELEKLFEIVGISKEHVPLGLEALKKDSQDGQFGKQGKAREATMEPRFLELVDRYMKKMEAFGFPPMTHDMSAKEFKQAFGLEN